ncbi:hypothetical protein [Jatrophihabitans fulvus]
MARDEADDEDDTESEVVAAAADRLYAAPPDDFTALRNELSKAAKSDGDADAARKIAKLRKPTAGAAVVNRYSLDEPGAVAPLTEVGDALRRAQQDLAADTLRELTTRRREVVAELTKAALAHSDKADATTALRDEVSQTFDAALADPDVAARLGRLVRGEQFSGFGFAAEGPSLTLVQGGRGKKPTPAKKASKTAAAKTPARKTAPEPAPPPARLTRRVERARADFEAADQAHAGAEADEERLGTRVRELADELAELQRDLDTAKRELEAARKRTRSARTSRREARSALDRAERALDRGQ